MDSTNDTTEKKIILQGTNNRYQIKKATKTQSDKGRKRKSVEQLQLSSEFYTYEKQIEILSYLFHIEKKSINQDPIYKIFTQQIERKIASYKQQDVEKKKYEPSKIINYENILSILLETQCKCFYCKEEVFILYEKVREEKQWTLDRIDNDLGHTIDNVVLACLQCNLKRRCRSKDGFLFTKQLKIVKKENNLEIL
jgi:hypothetical protein